MSRKEQNGEGFLTVITGIFWLVIDVIILAIIYYCSKDWFDQNCKKKYTKKLKEVQNPSPIPTIQSGSIPPSIMDFS